MKSIIILGSERKNGITEKVATRLSELLACECVNLLDLNIERFQYDQDYTAPNDFILLMDRITKEYDHIIFATPVYWYSMSGIMKIFFDRLSDLLMDEKEIGRKLRGKKMSVITSSIGNHLDQQFWLPFQETAEYMGMKFITVVHTLEEKNNEARLTTFVESIKE